MADIQCAICAEPWDMWGLHHGDVEDWHRVLFKLGAGCPCCKGQPTDEQREAAEEIEYDHAMQVIISGAWDAPDEFRAALGDPVGLSWEDRPKWSEDAARSNARAWAEDAKYRGVDDD
jgi:hypothetical protein